MTIVVSYIAGLVADDPSFQQIWHIAIKVAVPVGLVSALSFVVVDKVVSRFLPAGKITQFFRLLLFAVTLLFVSFLMGGYIYFNVFDILDFF